DFYFFFQAEDGIRDFHVTGVQTCALPISKKSTSSNQLMTFTLTTAFIQIFIFIIVTLSWFYFSGETMLTGSPVTSIYLLELVYRSEERRVGKECRSRWCWEQWKKRRVMCL